MAATHFYTANATEWQTALLRSGLTDEGVACYAYLQAGGGLAPLFRLFHPTTGAHFYTMNAAERDNAAQHLGYTSEGIACYIYPQQAPGTVPLYRAYQGSSDDHFYTTNLAEHQNAVAHLGYSDEGVTGWVLAAPAAGAVPLHRMYGPEAHTFFQNLGSMAGWVQVEVTSAGTITYSGHVHNDAAIAEAFDFRIRAVTGNAQAVLVQYSGHVAGTGGTPQERNCYWTQTETRADIAANYKALVAANAFHVYEDRKGSITGVLEEIGTFVGTWLGQVVLDTTVTALDYSGVGFLAFALAEAVGYATGTGPAVAQIVQGVLWLKGPDGNLFALAADGLALLGQHRRQITQEEYDWANAQVFDGTLPDRARIYLTDTLGGSGRPFTFPEVGGTISVNIGQQNYTNPRAPDFADIFVHELTHTWQIAHTPFDSVWMAQELAAQLAGPGSYNVGPPGPPFDTFGPEAQAVIVQSWYKNGQHTNDPYYVYIQDNIRAGRP